MICDCVTMDESSQLYSRSQKCRHERFVDSLAVAPGLTIDNETLTQVRQSAIRDRVTRVDRKTTQTTVARGDAVIEVMTKKQMERVMTAEVEARIV